MRVAAIVLAAGKSERMGRNKLLLKVAGKTILDKLLYILDDSDIDVFVVLGHQPDALMPIVENHRVKVVLNPYYEEGMVSSFKVGLQKVTADAVFIILGDQLGLERELLEKMIKTMESNPAILIVSPVFHGMKGHPVLFRKELFSEILAVSSGETIRDVIDRHEMAHTLIEGNIWNTIDFDTPEDFKRVKRLYRERVCSGVNKFG